MIIKKIKESKPYAFLRNFYHSMLSDETFFIKRHENAFGYTPDFKNPQTFNEKIVHRILYDKNPVYTLLADKLKARIYIASKLLDSSLDINKDFLNCTGGNKKVLQNGKPIHKPINDIKELLYATNLCEYLPKLYGIWDSVDQIDFSSLPNSFVLKTNHDGGGVVIVKDKQTFLMDNKAFKTSIEKLSKHLKTNFYTLYREYHYKDIEPKIFAEELLSEDLNCFVQPKDYKLHCFKNKIFTQVDVDRFTNHTRAIYDENWQKQSFSLCYPLYMGEMEKIQNFEEMKTIAHKLVYPFAYIRVDLYNLDGNIKIGELTLTHGGGSEKFTPYEWDKKLGEFWIDG